MGCSNFSSAVVCYTDASGVRAQLIAHYEYRIAASGEAVLHATRYTEGDGVTVIDTTGGQVSAGGCLPIGVTVIGGGINIAGPARASTAEFAGAADVWSTSAVPGTLHSLTVSARSISDALPGLASDQVSVDMPDGSKYTLMNGETRTFSVTRDNDTELKREYLVTAAGLAYANITYTYF